MRSVFLSLILFPVLALGQTPQPEPTPPAVLNSARRRLLADIDAQPRYTCVQNITRQIYRASSGKQSCSALIAASDARKHDQPLASWERLRMDVAIADNREVHAWPDASRFSDEEVLRFLGPGAFGTGDFGGFISGIFGGSAVVKFQGKHVQDGRTLFDYTYEVSQQASRYRVGYRVHAASAPVITAYGGSFALDSQTADIVELKVVTAELPESTHMCQARSQIEYGRLDIHGREVLIPRETRLRLNDPDGSAGLSTISYSSCREYTGKAVLRFDNAATSAETIPSGPVKSATPSPPVSPFPAGLKFNCRIVTPIDSDRAAAGSSIEAILRTPIREKSGTVLAPLAHAFGDACSASRGTSSLSITSR